MKVVPSLHPSSPRRYITPFASSFTVTCPLVSDFVAVSEGVSVTANIGVTCYLEVEEVGFMLDIIYSDKDTEYSFDYTATQTLVAIPTTQTSFTFSVEVNDDVVEDFESFCPKLNDVLLPSTFIRTDGGQAVPSTATVTVNGDDTAVCQVDQSPVCATEGVDSHASVTLTCDKVIEDRGVMIDLANRDRAAFNPEDYFATVTTALVPTGSLAFPVLVPLNDDMDVEDDDSFEVILVAVSKTGTFGRSDVARLGNDVSASVTFKDTDSENDITGQRNMSIFAQKLEFCSYHNVADVIKKSFWHQNEGQRHPSKSVSRFRGKATRSMENLLKSCHVGLIQRKESNHPVHKGVASRKVSDMVFYNPPGAHQNEVGVCNAADSCAYIRGLFFNDDAENGVLVELFNEDDVINETEDKLMSSPQYEAMPFGRVEADITFHGLSKETGDIVVNDGEDEGEGTERNGNERNITGTKKEVLVQQFNEEGAINETVDKLISSPHDRLVVTVSNEQDHGQLHENGDENAHHQCSLPLPNNAKEITREKDMTVCSKHPIPQQVNSQLIADSNLNPFDEDLQNENLMDTTKETNSSHDSKEAKYMKTKSHHMNAHQSGKRGTKKKPCLKPPFTRLIPLAFVLSVLNVPICAASDILYCPVNQTAELGKVGTIDCKFPDSFLAVYWYDNPAPNGSAVVVYTRYSQNKRGPGLLNNTFDIAENGSLVISKVGVAHEGAYVVIIQTNPDSFERNNVSLKVVVYPGNGTLKTECHNCRQNYYHVDDGSNTVTCFFDISRPPVQIEWIKWSINGDSLVKNQTNNIVDNRDGTYNSSATVNLTKSGYKQIAEFVCRASWGLGTWRRETEILIDYSRDEWFLNLKMNNILEREVNSKIEIHCEGSGQDSKIWKKVSRPHEPETIGYSTGDVTVMTKKISGMEISDDGNLVFSSLQTSHEGLYACLYSGGTQDEIKMTKLVVLEPPSSLHLQIIGCKDNGEEPCKFKEEDTGRITFAVYDASHNFSAKWIFEKPNCVSFPSQEISVTERGEIAVSKTFEVCEDVSCEEELLIKCYVYDPVVNSTSVSTAAVIIPKTCKKGVNTFLTIFAILVAIVIAVLLVFICIRYKRTCARQEDRHKIADAKEITEDETGCSV